MKEVETAAAATENCARLHVSASFENLVPRIYEGRLVLTHDPGLTALLKILPEAPFPEVVFDVKPGAPLPEAAVPEAAVPEAAVPEPVPAIPVALKPEVGALKLPVPVAGWVAL